MRNPKVTMRTVDRFRTRKFISIVCVLTHLMSITEFPLQLENRQTEAAVVVPPDVQGLWVSESDCVTGGACDTVRWLHDTGTTPTDFVIYRKLAVPLSMLLTTLS